MKLFLHCLIFTLAAGCSPSVELWSRTSECAILDDTGKLNYRSLRSAESINIDLERREIIFSDFVPESEFCGSVGDFCVERPFVSSSYSKIAELESALAEKGWVLGEKRFSAIGTKIHIEFISPDGTHIWQSTYSEGEDFPLSILLMRRDQPDGDQPILGGLIKECPKRNICKD